MAFPLYFMAMLFVPIMAYATGDYVFISIFPIIVIGVLLNRHVMAHNGVKMPVKMNDEVAPFVSEKRAYAPITEKTRFGWLGDRFRIKIGKTPRLVSIGDLFVYTGCLLVWVYFALIFYRGVG